MRILCLGLALLLCGCGPSQAVKEKAVYDAADAVLACYGKLDMPLPDYTLPEDRHAALTKEFSAEVTRRRNEQQAHAVERVAAAKSLYPAESDTARELARIQVMLGSDWG